jgi:hypothetical protein
VHGKAKFVQSFQVFFCGQRLATYPAVSRIVNFMAHNAGTRKHNLSQEQCQRLSSFAHSNESQEAATLGDAVAVVPKFYSHESSKVRQGKTDKAIQATRVGAGRYRDARRGDLAQSCSVKASSTFVGGPPDAAATPGFGIIQLQAAQPHAAKVEFSSQISIRRPDSFPGGPIWCRKRDPTKLTETVGVGGL